MATVEREEFSVGPTPRCWPGCARSPPRTGWLSTAVVENALRCYCNTEPYSNDKADDKVMTHFLASVEKNSGLLELLAQ